MKSGRNGILYTIFLVVGYACKVLNKQKMQKACSKLHTRKSQHRELKNFLPLFVRGEEVVEGVGVVVPS